MPQISFNKVVCDVNFSTAVRRIEKTNTKADLDKLGKSLDRVYDAGFLTIRDWYDLRERINTKHVQL